MLCETVAWRINDEHQRSVALLYVSAMGAMKLRECRLLSIERVAILDSVPS